MYRLYNIMYNIENELERDINEKEIFLLKKF